MVIRVGIIGATGHTAEVLIGLLLRHPYVKITRLYNSAKVTQLISDLFPKFKNRLELPCKKVDWTQIKRDCDLLFLALPHTVSMQFAPKLISLGKKVIDLSADYRLKSPVVYEKNYKFKHSDKANLKRAVYGLPELCRARIKSADLVANPGCYPTAAILGAAPLLALGLVDPDSVIIDAKSGVSGAGKKLEKEYLFSEVGQDFRAYKVNVHQHAPEIDQELSKLTGKKMQVVFVPHLLPIERGILATIYAKKLKSSRSGILELYKRFYKHEPFIRIKEKGFFPRIKDTLGTNFCDIGIQDDPKAVIIISAVDNLMKGASSQAVQNMNIMYKLPETEGLL